MIEPNFMGLFAIPAGLGLIDILEPWSIGSSLVFAKYLEGTGGAAKLAETTQLAGAAAWDGATALTGFVALAVFGLFLSLPLVAVVLFPGARGLLDRFAALSGRYPIPAGLMLVALGARSIWFSLFAAVKPRTGAVT